ncbi:MAG: hypothetical protein AB1941_18910 [Gemmatimonadota bacterium]
MRPLAAAAEEHCRRAEALKRAADEARERAAALRRAMAARRSSLSFRDQMAIWEETHRTLLEMEEAAAALAEERVEAEREVAEQTAWVRAQVEGMLESGWTREELRDIGIADEVLAQIGLLDDPRLREPGAGSREPGAGSREPGAGSREPDRPLPAASTRAHVSPGGSRPPGLSFSPVRAGAPAPSLCVHSVHCNMHLPCGR